MKWLSIRVGGSLIMVGAFILEVVEGEADLNEVPLLGRELRSLWKEGL